MKIGCDFVKVQKSLGYLRSANALVILSLSSLTRWYRDFACDVRLVKIGYLPSKTCENDSTYRFLDFRAQIYFAELLLEWLQLRSAVFEIF